MFETAIAGSLPKPSWLAETEKLWPEWKASGAELERDKADATLLWLKVQEDAGIDIVGDGEQSRQHFVHGFLARVEGIDFDAQGEDGNPQQPLRRDGAAGGRTAASGGPRPRQRGTSRACAHRAQAEVHPARADDDRRHGRRPLLRRRQGRSHQAGVRVRRAAQPGSASRSRPTASTSSSSTSPRSTSTWPTPPSGAWPRSSAPPRA